MYKIISGKGRTILDGVSLPSAKRRAVRMYERHPDRAFRVVDGLGNVVWAIG